LPLELALRADCCRSVHLNAARSEQVLYTGALIDDLRATVERAAEAAASRAPELSLQPPAQAESSESEQFAQPLCLRPADWNLALFLIVHAQLVRTLEPGHDFANTIDIHQVRSMSPPEQPGIQTAE
jgi:hypothetical protein